MLLPILGVLSLAGVVYFLMPLTIGVCHIGMFWPAALLLLAAIRCFFPGFCRRLPKWLKGLVMAGVSLVLAVAAVVFTVMGVAAADRPSGDDAPDTVVLLGCQVYNGQPSMMLRGRIQAAYDYLSRHPEAVCVASGGQNDSEPITEAACIRDTLAEMGIDPARIYLEDKSTSTEENLAFSAQVIAENGLPATAAIASDSFHQLRAAIWAERSGLTPCSLGCASPWYLTAGYWAREAAALVYMVIMGK